MNDSFQFYPTPRSLARRAWDMFKNKEITRLLEPSAGKGDLVLGRLTDEEQELVRRYGNRSFKWDAIEPNGEFHARLEELGAKVVGYDFLAHTNCSIYSHILMNPPFAHGAEHVLHAWNTLFVGEIVAIINAETIRNPFSKERKQLVEIIKRHGRVEFVQDAFKGEEVEREADVEVALVHLVKEADASAVLGELVDELRKDTREPTTDWKQPNEVMLPRGLVEDTVQAFDIAVAAAREAAAATARAEHYRKMLGLTLSERIAKDGEPKQGDASANPSARLAADANTTAERAREQFAKAYDELKDAAWAQILRSTHLKSRLSSTAQKRLEAEFARIKALEFTCANVYGFLEGLANSAHELQMEMVCGVFDLITKYHSENTVYYMGWRSNDKHRTVGMRVKSTRFILPSEAHCDWRQSASYEVCQMLADFDKVFAMLDGKAAPDVSLAGLFSNRETYRQLRAGKRLSSDYFDVRYYGGIGTIHFFPRRKDLMDRLNRLVGRQRKWLPVDPSEETKDFTKQYEQAEKFVAEVTARFKDKAKASRNWEARDICGLTSSYEETRQAVEEVVAAVLDEVLEERGIHPFARLEDRPAPLQLAAA